MSHTSLNISFSNKTYHLFMCSLYQDEFHVPLSATESSFTRPPESHLTIVTSCMRADVSHHRNHPRLSQREDKSLLLTRMSPSRRDEVGVNQSDQSDCSPGLDLRSLSNTKEETHSFPFHDVYLIQHSQSR